jgi:hypothetical protein
MPPGDIVWENMGQSNIMQILRGVLSKVVLGGLLGLTFFLLIQADNLKVKISEFETLSCI